MFGNLDESQLESAIEALLFVTDEPVNVITLSEMLDIDAGSVQEALMRIEARKRGENAGVLLREVSGGWRLYTNPAFHELLEQYILSWDTRRLSQASLETLAIIAYGQPITRLGISSIRGVNSDSSVNSLIEKGLVRESGQADAPGYPMTYSTTRTFLEKFGLRDRDDLPPIEDFAPTDETARLLREGLSAHAHFGLKEDGEEQQNPPLYGAENEGAEDKMRAVMQAALSDAIAQSAGVVEKIDFDQLDFEE